MQQKRKLLSIILLIMLVTLSACGWTSSGGDTSLDPPQIDYTVMDPMGDQTANSPDKQEEQTGSLLNQANKLESNMVQSTLYLLDQNGFVTPVTKELPFSESVAQQVLEHMIAGGPVESMIPVGFQALLPAGTKVQSIDIQQGVATVDFSKEFTQYAPGDELKILQGITWALTEFPTVNEVVIWVNGERLEQMPVALTPIPKPLNRAMGINVEMGRYTTVGHTMPVTLYFTATSPNGVDYHVPVTRLVQGEQDVVMATVVELIKGPDRSSKLVSPILPSTKLIHAEVNEEQQSIVANFDPTILGWGEEQMMSRQVYESIVLSLLETTSMGKVQVLVNGSADYATDSNQSSQLAEKPIRINRISF